MKKNLTTICLILFCTVIFSQTKPSIDWVEIPAGSFLMGSPEKEAGRENDEVQHKVKLEAFKMSKYEISFDQYDKFCEATGRVKPKDNGKGRGKLPVFGVSWIDATAFAEWMGCRLPTEAEWEYACRAKSKTPFNTGSDYYSITLNANVGGLLKMGKNIPVLIGSYKPNKWGLFDMHGNVNEWCSDWYGDYSVSDKEQVNPTGPEKGTKRVMRGGDWWLDVNRCRSAARFSMAPEQDYNMAGIRIVFVEKKEIVTQPFASSENSKDLQNSQNKTKQNENIAKDPLHNYEMLSDFEGNKYKTIKIGNQIWMAENLRSSKYSDGEMIVDSLAQNANYINDSKIYGRIYSWNALMRGSSLDGAQGVCPTGWHVPMVIEWEELIQFAGGNELAGQQLKIDGTKFFPAPNTGTNKLGFSIIPSPTYSTENGYVRPHRSAYFWTSTNDNQYSGPSEYTTGFSYNVLNSQNSIIQVNSSVGYYFSVRCIKD